MEDVHASIAAFRNDEENEDMAFHFVVGNDEPRVTYSSVIRASVEELTLRSPFLLREEDTTGPPLALLDRHELHLGDLLGHGNFSNVYAVIGFRLDNNQISKRPPLSPRTVVDRASGSSAELTKGTKSRTGNTLQENLGIEIEAHLMNQQRRRLATKLKNGSSMYAVKCLKPELLENANPNVFLGAATDLVIEAKYLSRFNHPNILKIRGLARGWEAAFANGEFDSFFILTDKLEETLNQRIRRWKHGEGMEENTIKQKLKISLQVANALCYLSDHNLLYRDLKPQNIGLIRDEKSALVVKLFDFGFCRELPKDDQSRDDKEATGESLGASRLTTGEAVFMMSGKGTRRYMAPEVLLHRPYNMKCDVYSWSMVCWELLTLHKPYYNYAKEQHALFVCEEGERPPLENPSLWVSPSFPSPSASLSSMRSAFSKDGDDIISTEQFFTDPIRDLLRNAWHQDVSKRLSIQEVRHSLKSILDDLHGDVRDDTNGHGLSHSCMNGFDGIRDTVLELTADLQCISLMACLGYDAVMRPESIKSADQISVLPQQKSKQLTV